ncbi:MAG TPA: VOC family protein [Dermatophilaceae bacterium]|nr:VOC family protein [Dermatophilaceae bacterium]
MPAAVTRIGVDARDPVLSLGARVLRGPDRDGPRHVLADPEGSGFCVLDHGPGC